MSVEVNTEELSKKLHTILNSNDSATKSIIKDLLTAKSNKKSNPELEKQKAIILRKLNESD